MAENGLRFTFKRSPEDCPHESGTFDCWAGAVADGAGNYHPSRLISRVCSDCGKDMRDAPGDL